jgi:c-di-GMP-binding flagellar brake protein YcgR
MDEAILHTFDRSVAVWPAVERPSFTNDRKHPRISAGMRKGDDVTIADPDGGAHLSARLLDVSAGGIGASCRRGPVLEGTYGVRFPLYLNGEARMVTACMKVVYCVRQGRLGSYRIGFQLLRPEA